MSGPSAKVRRSVEAATVQFLDDEGRLIGQGVLVPGPLILTAAHVVCPGGIPTVGSGAVLNELEYLRRIATATGQRFRIYAEAVEPILDLAVLGPVDGQWIPEDDDAFEAFAAATVPIPLATEDIYTERDFRRDLKDLARRTRRHAPLARTAPAYVLTHTRDWLRGRVTQTRPRSPAFMLTTEKMTEGGTSGGPVVTSDGRLLGVISWASGGGRLDTRGWALGNGGTIPRPHRTAPVHLVERMSQGGGRRARARARHG